MPKEIPQYVQNRLSKEGFSSSLRVLELMRTEGSVTQRSVAKRVGLSFGTCSLHFKKLESLRLIQRVDVQSQKGVAGRSATIWELAWQGNGFLLILFKTSFVELTLIDFGGRVCFRKRENISGLKTGKSLLDQLGVLVDEAVGVSKKISCIIRHVLVAVPGVLDRETSRVIQFVHFPVINGIDFVGWMKIRFDLPCNCVSTGDIIYYGEVSRFSAETRVMVITWDMGIGMVVGVGGQIISCPEKLFLSELGHLRVRPNGRLCYCGRKGCLEAYVGGHAMLDMLDDPAIQTLDAWVDAVHAGYAPALKIMQDAAWLLGESLTWPLQVTGTEKLLIAGPLGALMPQFRDRLEQGLSSLFVADEIQNMDLEPLENSQEVLTRGAFEMACCCFFSPAE